MRNLSGWAMAANRILFGVAYQGPRGFRPMGHLLPKCLDVKAEYVLMAELDEGRGEPWDTIEFNRVCREGFQKILEGE